MKTNIDSVTLSILVNNLFWIAEEMNAYLAKAAFSTNIKVRRDCSCALYTRNGDMIAQGEFIPVHLGIMANTLKEVLKKHPAKTFHEGDVLIHNDPFSMGSHLFDVMLFKPIFFSGELIGFAGSLAHHVDIGGSAVDGGVREVFEEGLRLPPVLLYRDGVLQEDILNIICNNVRTPYEAKGDLSAQSAACFRGETRIQELAEKFGTAALLDYFEAILDYSERGMRDVIRKLPNGKAWFEDYLEFDGINDCMIKIRVNLEVRDDELLFSFDGSDAPAAGGANSVWSLTHSAIYYAVKAVLASNIPTNSGAYRPINLIRPNFPTIVDAQYPHAINSCTSRPSQRIVDVAIGAFSKLVPDKTCACDGHWAGGRFVGIDPRNGRYSSYVETYACGRGAKHDQDGADAHQTHMTNTANAPIEIIELEHPLTIDEYALVQDSCGAGEYRGGVGITRKISCESDMAVSVSTMRPGTHPYGLFGGAGGACDLCYIELDDGEKVTSSKDAHKGNVAVIRTSGGGGWGNPLRRDLDAIDRDLLDEYISPAHAQQMYQVVVDPATNRVDREKTWELRSAL